MPGTNAFSSFGYRRSPDQQRKGHHEAVIVGAGPVGLSLAIDLAQRGVKAVVVDDSDRIGGGSRAICFAKRTLEIFDRLGVAAPMLEKGVRWQVGKVFQGPDQLYQFDLQSEPGHKMPAFINLQQYYVEKHLVDRAMALDVDIRWKNRVEAIRQVPGGAHLTIGTPDGPYGLDADYVFACDGARSPIRGMMGLNFAGEQFEDQFLIADVRMTADFPVERWFWFDPPFHSGRSCLLHKQPDGVWRIDLQLSPEADADHERQPEIVRPRIERMLGHRDFELAWVSVYRFQCRRLDRFVHDRVVFAGDAAHQVSPFGARGANSGVQDAENLAWKLAAVLAGKADAGLIESYDQERSAAADENILNSTRATDFIAPRSEAELQFRNAALSLARSAPFARSFVNSGRLSLPTTYVGSALSTPDAVAWTGGPPPGAPIPDLPLKAPGGADAFLCEALGQGFTWVASADSRPAGLPEDVACIEIGDASGRWRDHAQLFARRFDAAQGAGYLIRPDGHVAARFKVQPGGSFDGPLVRRALARALAA